MKRIIAILLLVVAIFSLAPVQVFAAQTEIQKLMFPFYTPEGEDTTAQTGSTAEVVGCDAAEQIWNYFTETRGLAPGVAAGFLGNMEAEAHFEPRLVEYGFQNSRGETSRPGQPSSLDDQMPPIQVPRTGQPGYGIIQWTSPGRRNGLQQYATDTGRPVSSLVLQLDYVWVELSGSYRSSTLNPLQALGPDADPRAASEIITRHYEIPSNMAEAVRTRGNAAHAFFTRFTSGQGCS